MLLVSALILQRDGKATHSVENYVRRFDDLARFAKHDIVLFCDAALIESMKPHTNVRYVPTSFCQLPLHKELGGHKDIHLPKERNLDKDTYDYLVIQNSKTYFLDVVARAVPTYDAIAWIDAGITHVFKDPEGTLARLDLICAPEQGVAIPGCRGWHRELIQDRINWHFCGGFVIGRPHGLKNFHTACTDAIQQNKPYLTWEVNMWAQVHERHWPTIRRYEADHNDTLLTNY